MSNSFIIYFQPRVTMASNHKVELLPSDYEYVIVGSGAGGGPLSANLARHGHQVLLLEAGDDQGQSLMQKVPAFHIVATEDPAIRWDFFVKHYDDETQAARDPKMTWGTPDGKMFIGVNPPPGSKQKGVYYPRAGTLGGCTAHNALITVLPPDEDWARIANITNDSSWGPQQMKRYFERLERCGYLSEGTDGHGFGGWLETNHADPIVLTSKRTFVEAALHAVPSPSKQFKDDVNSREPQVEGAYELTLSMSERGRRSSARNYLVATANARNADGSKKYPLHIRMRSLATSILFSGNDGKPKAIGVEFLEGKSMYKADPTFDPKHAGIKRRVFASREVIVAGGSFNTPQLLKLSGIGPKEELQKFGIPVRVNLPGVGYNLQDNYEYPVIYRCDQNLSIFQDSLFGSAGDPSLTQWVQEGNGPYRSIAETMAVKKKSKVSEDGELDLFLFGGAKTFPGYFPGYSKVLGGALNKFCWNLIKTHPRRSQAGSVTLCSADPRDLPEVNFRFFSEHDNQDRPDDDLTAIADGVEFARSILKSIPEPIGPMVEEFPGTSIERVDALKQDIKDKAFSHHATSTCHIGADGDPMACLDSRFRVRGVESLRVVDASVFPHVPGAFPALPVYMISEKATDVILEDIELDLDDAVLGEALEDMVLENSD